MQHVILFSSIYQRAFPKFAEKIFWKVFATDLSCEISNFLRRAILKDTRGELILYDLF